MKKVFVYLITMVYFFRILKYSLVTNWGLLLFLKGELVLESFQTIVSTGISKNDVFVCTFIKMQSVRPFIVEYSKLVLNQAAAILFDEYDRLKLGITPSHARIENKIPRMYPLKLINLKQRQVM